MKLKKDQPTDGYLIGEVIKKNTDLQVKINMRETFVDGPKEMQKTLIIKDAEIIAFNLETRREKKTTIENISVGEEILIHPKSPAVEEIEKEKIEAKKVTIFR